jgi:hypothetical protein
VNGLSKKQLGWDIGSLQWVKPWRKKIEAIEALQPPTTFKELRSFIGAANFYRDMWPQRSHILSPLTELTGATHFCWEQQRQSEFKQMKKLLAADAMFAYPDQNFFYIYTDASDFNGLSHHAEQTSSGILFSQAELHPA